MAKNLTSLVLFLIGILIAYNIYRSTTKYTLKEGHKTRKKCSDGCTKHKNLDGYCDNKVHHDGDGKNTYRKCKYRCPPPTDTDYHVDQDCTNDEDCEGCGTFGIHTNKTGTRVHNDKKHHPYKDDGGGDYHHKRYGRGYHKDHCDDNGYGDNGYGDNGYGDNGYGDNYYDDDYYHHKRDKDRRRRNKWDYRNKSSLFGGRAGSDVPSEGAYELTSYTSGQYKTKEISRSRYEKMGRMFLNDEVQRKGMKPVKILDSEAEVLGRLVYRVSEAQKKGVNNNSPNNREVVMKRETELLQNLAHILRAGSSKFKPRNHDSVYNDSGYVNNNRLPREYSHKRTTNMFSHIPHAGNRIKRKEGWKYEGHRVRGHPDYDDVSVATDTCAKHGGCIGINFDSTRGIHVLMGHNSKLVRAPGYVAYVKESGKNNVDGHESTSKSSYNILGKGPRHSNSCTHPRDKGRNSDDKHRRYKNYRKYDQYHENRQHKDYKDESRRPSSYPVSQAYATNTKTNKNASMLSGKPAASPYNEFAPTNKPLNPNTPPAAYNSLMGLFR